MVRCYNQIMRWAEVDWFICQGCDPCAARDVCKPRAITKMIDENCMYIDPQRCSACGECLIVCSFAAIRLFDPARRLDQTNKIEDQGGRRTDLNAD